MVSSGTNRLSLVLYLSWDRLLSKIGRIRGVRAGALQDGSKFPRAKTQEPESLVASYSSGRVCRGVPGAANLCLHRGTPHFPHCQILLYIGGLLSKPSDQSSRGDEWGAVPFSQFNAAQCQFSIIGRLHPRHGTLQPEVIDVNLVQPSDFTKNWNSKEIKRFVQMTNWYQSLAWKPDSSSLGQGRSPKCGWGLQRWEVWGPEMRRRIPPPRAWAVRRAGISGRVLHLEVELLHPVHTSRTAC